MAMINEPAGKAHGKSGAEAERGAVLGIDVGWSAKKPTTGLCLVEWTNRNISLCCCEAGADEGDRQKSLDRLIRGKRLLAVGIDGPLIPKLEIANRYRAAEALLSRGRFQRRGKPGPINGGSGPKLHKQATKLAKLVVNTQDIVSASYPYKIHGKQS